MHGLPCLSAAGTTTEASCLTTIFTAAAAAATSVSCRSGDPWLEKLGVSK
jgi:hypothetical protein